VLELDRHTEYRWFDEVLSAYGARASVELRLANPYRVDEASTLTVRRGRSGSGSFMEHTATYHADPFRIQWLHVYDCVVHGRRPLSDGPGAAEDVQLAEAIVRALPQVRPS
jgi:predicted dehydrogenase